MIIKNKQLLKQVFQAVNAIAAETDNPEHKILLSGADAVMNELLLQEDVDYYIRLFKQGVDLIGKSGTQTDSSSFAEVTTSSRPDVINAALVQVQQALTEIVAKTDSKTNKDYLNKVCDWQESLYHRQMVRDTEVLHRKPLNRDTLFAYLQEKFPEWKNLRLTAFHPLPGGFSKTTILFETEDELNGHQSMVLRAEKKPSLLLYRGTDVACECAMMRFMEREGIPTIEPLWLEEDASKLGNRFLVTRRDMGERRGANLGSTAPLPDELIEDVLDVMVKMHSIRPEKNDPLVMQTHLPEWLHCKTVTECNRYYVTRFLRNYMDAAEILVPPTLERALQWLQENVPESGAPAVIAHLDFGLNNLLFIGNSISAVLDWESSHLSDPAEDLLGAHPSLSEFISLEDFIARYEAKTGNAIGEYRINYSRVAKYVINTICFLRAEKMLDIDDSANIDLSRLGIAYKGVFMVGLNNMIEAAEAAMGR
ncbi:MAG: phosphotransferase family protein [Halieaceae bacterium]|nr:phosphotransferase family protein [Halieaceae bacterium]